MHRTVPLLLLTACWGATAPPVPPEVTPAPPDAKSEPAAPAAAVDPEQAALDKADAAITALRQRLKARLSEAMGAGGPEAAVRVCAEEAGQLADAVAAEHGAKVGRASLRMRHSGRAAPAWVEGWLQAQGERPAEGVPGARKTDRAPNAVTAQVLAPLAVEAPCLICHGPVETIPPAVRTILAERYPDDAATGYALGDLRGAVWAEVSVPVSPPG
jgi:hypothetical protein